MIVASSTNLNLPDRGLLHSRYETLASNTIDYWMLPDDRNMSAQRIDRAIKRAPRFSNSTLQLYIHVPFCAQRCRFCAFSGGNDLDFRQAERYSRLVVAQVRELIENSQARRMSIKSVNVGGGSPDLLGTNVEYLLKSVQDLPGVNSETEISVEFTLSTVSKEFIDCLAQYGVTKASFGIQSLDPTVRRHMRQPKRVLNLEKVLTWIDGRIPVVNADLITGMPGQSLRIVMSDLKKLMNESRINAISSYLLTPGAAPALLAALANDKIPAMPQPCEQALMRLHTYSTFLRNGWVRKGTNTYVDPARISEKEVNRIAGNECIGASHYEDFLLGAGPQAISYLPGARVENLVNIKAWAEAVENGTNAFHLPKCSDQQQRDTALWVFPLRWEGLAESRFDELLNTNALTRRQLDLFETFQDEGLIAKTSDGYRLSILGEVFMGRLVRDLKSAPGQQAVDQYIAEGYALGDAISTGTQVDENSINNRQIVGQEDTSENRDSI